MLRVPGPRYVPWRWRRNQAPSFYDPAPLAQNGWLLIQLVRRPSLNRLRSMWNLGAPTLDAAAFYPLPPAIYLQAVNRASTT